MTRHRRLSSSRRTFLKSSIAASTLFGLGVPLLNQPHSVAAASRVRAHEWHTAPRDNENTAEVSARSLDGNFQLEQNANGTFERQRTFVSDVYDASNDFNMVGMRWIADVPPATMLAVEIRSSLDGREWTNWTPVGHVLQRDDHDVTTAETFTDAVEVGRAGSMQYRIMLSTENPQLSPTVRRVTATLLDALDSPTLDDLAQRGPGIPFTITQTDPPLTKFIPRDGPLGWNPDVIPPDSPLYWPPLSGEFPFEFVTIHHTAGANNPENPLATVRAIWYYHTITLGWGDIGYHFLIDQFGNVYEGRDGGDSTVGGHVFRYNSHNCGISFLGQFQPNAPDVPYPGGEPTLEARYSATVLAAIESVFHDFDLREQHTYPFPTADCRPQIDNYRLSGHRDWGHPDSCVATACPGDNLYQYLPQIREDAAELVPVVERSTLARVLSRILAVR
ncbi:MAG: hypothetical protein GFH27_549281n179 [Chloroflexi bacterium AL-W]|nr:hypothetical protein [Chloroflexi bacterium AL-N1]NOK66065.1 hypothetical protein [Chloroflexi bacterium AL-N10]NOK72946.1 hypothetical protein [Chloroflexi bacterium AL-N5]NOK79843.1 hypothetical protein [Chloroflexi bacterium AL-W]NOK88301.1 hypothetical protein [Chloroflexi bacterium AL-N15]